MKILVIIIAFWAMFLYSQGYVEPEYNLLDKFENADLNYLAIDSINLIDKGISMLETVFKVVPGNYTVYRFMTSDRGIIFDEYVSDMNNLIILKVDSSNHIIDGYQYFLQNPEMPSSCKLYKLTKKLKIKSKIKINEFKFKKIIDINDEVFEICKDIPLFLKDNRFLEFK